MKEASLKIAQQDIEEALKDIEEMEQVVDLDDSSKQIIKEKFESLTKKVQRVEEILKSEGIL